MSSVAPRPLQVVFRTLLRIARHPENRGRRIRRLCAWVGWQLWQRVVRRPITVGFTDGLRVRCRPHDPVSSAVIYCGLPDHEEMRFLLAWLEPGDDFADVGSHVGLYSLLAAGVAGARATAFEPDAAHARWLRENLAINGLEHEVSVIESAVGGHDGRAVMTSGDGPMNRLLGAGELDDGRDGLATAQVAVVTLDSWVAAGGGPDVLSAVKIDVEGAELEVLQGGGRLLSRHRPALIVEVNDPVGLAQWAEAHRYHPVTFEPDGRRLRPRVLGATAGGNVIMVPDVGAARARLVRR